MKKIALALIGFYQRFLTLFSYGSCRYYPTCSQYAKEQIMFNNFFKALFFSILRILRCNQLFVGGIDYPVVKKVFNRVSFVRRYQSSLHKVSFWFVPKDEKSFFVVKSFKNTI
ncbi:membrane protein insertion efficiency factor YidD [Sulfurospirillum sp. 1612]|uniref:membrane protein insertion efficiency factor YidD n=1 Tax=Sulfurospirillum sp. 1612 TaxID=3094835 RepID=UPI002F91E981